MLLTAEQQAILNGEQGEVKAKIMKTLVMYGETFHAEKMVPVTSKYGHLVTSFGMGIMDGVLSLMDQLIDAGVTSAQEFSVDPRPTYKQLPKSLVTDLVSSKFMYNRQDRYEKQLEKMGLMNKDAFTCTCYMDEVGNKPKKGDVLSWAESSAVVYANSVLGARCNRNSGVIEMFGSIIGYVPYFGLLTDEGRKATWIVEVRTSKKPEAQLLGSAIGMKVMEDVPYIKGLNSFIGNELTDEVCEYLKDMGAATASNGAVGLYHIDKLTPEAVEQGESLISQGAQIYVIDDAELQRVYDNYPVIWADKNAEPKLCFIGCPHLSLHQLIDWTVKVEEGLKEAGRDKVALPTVLTAAPKVQEAFKDTEYYAKAVAMGLRLDSVCALMYMNNPIAKKKPVITNSNKLRTYTTARYYTDDEILTYITKGGK